MKAYRVSPMTIILDYYDDDDDDDGDDDDGDDDDGDDDDDSFVEVIEEDTCPAD